MKVVLIGPVYPYRGGISHHTTMLAKTLKSISECRVISFKRQYPKRIYPGRTDIDPSAQILEIEAEYGLDPLNPLTWIQTARAIIRWKPDHLVIQWWVTIWGPLMSTVAFLCQRAGIPVTFMVHNVLPHEYRFWDHMLSKSTLRWGSHFVVHSEQERCRLQRMMPEANVSQVPHPPYNMFSSNHPKREQAKAALGIDQGAITLLFFGMVREYKGLAYVLEAVSLLKNHGHTPRLIIAGEFWTDKEHYLELIQNLGIIDEVIIDDRYIPNEQVGRYFSAADVVTVPYVGGTQSGVAAIAIGFGLPIIATEHIQSGIFTTNPDSIFVVPPASAPAIMEAVVQIMNSHSPERSHEVPGEQAWDSVVQAIIAGRKNSSPKS